MAFFSNEKKTTSIVKKVRPTVVKTENVAKEIASIAKEYGVKQESLDFNILDVRTYIRPSASKEWEEIDNQDLHDIDDKKLLDPDFQIKQVYEIEVFSRFRNKDPLEEFKIAIGANATVCKVFMQVKEGSVLRYYPSLREELRSYINKHKVRAGVLIYIFDEMLDDLVSKLAAKVQVEEIITYEKTETILIAQSIEPTQTLDGTLVLHYEKKEENTQEGRVDYANRGYIRSVYKDELLIEYIKPSLGQPGRDCRGRYIEPKEPDEENPIEFEIDEETIYIKEDEHSIKFFAKENGYIAFEENRYTIKSEADVNQVTFRTTGSITVGTDSDVNLVVTEADAIKDAIGTGMKVEVTELDVEGNVGNEAYVKAIKVNVGGQTHKTSVIEADNVDINVHKGEAIGKDIKVTRLEHGTLRGQNVYVSQAMGGRIYGENVVVDICTSYLKVYASHRIEIKKMRGSENIFVIDPLQQTKARESFEKNKEDIEGIKSEIKKYKKSIESATIVVKKNHNVFNDIKRHLIQYKKKGIKLPEAYVKQYKLYQAQIDKLKELKESYKKLEEKLHLLSNQTDSLQYSIKDARVINRSEWKGYNEIRAKLIDPPMELVYKPKEKEPYHVYGIVEDEEGNYEIKPLKEDI